MPGHIIHCPERGRRVEFFCDGGVGPVGAAFVSFLLREYGTSRFLELCFACRPERFEAECQRLYGADLATLEKRFWEDAERLADKW
jgi:hypothetical protein